MSRVVRKASYVLILIHLSLLVRASVYTMYIGVYVSVHAQAQVCACVRVCVCLCNLLLSFCYSLRVFVCLFVLNK